MSSVFLKLSLQCQLSLFLLWLPLSTTCSRLGKTGHAKCITSHSFHVASCNSGTLRFEPIHSASAQADLYWSFVYGSHSEHSTETQLINRPAVLLLGIFKSSATIWGNYQSLNKRTVSHSRQTLALTHLFLIPSSYYNNSNNKINP